MLFPKSSPEGPDPPEAWRVAGQEPGPHVSTPQTRLPQDHNGCQASRDSGVACPLLGSWQSFIQRALREGSLLAVVRVANWSFPNGSDLPPLHRLLELAFSSPEVRHICLFLDLLTLGLP